MVQENEVPEDGTVIAEVPKKKTTPLRFCMQITFGVAVAALIMSQSDNIWGFWWNCIWVPMLALFGLKPS